jgi:hypothetical protein
VQGDMELVGLERIGREQGKHHWEAAYHWVHLVGGDKDAGAGRVRVMQRGLV